MISMARRGGSTFVSGCGRRQRGAMGMTPTCSWCHDRAEQSGTPESYLPRVVAASCLAIPSFPTANRSASLSRRMPTIRPGWAHKSRTPEIPVVWRLMYGLEEVVGCADSRIVGQDMCGRPLLFGAVASIGQSLPVILEDLSC